jgi:Holliday junction resolvasome RuvABC endonuclease subunit
MKLIAMDADSFKLAIAIFIDEKLESTLILDSDKKINADLRGVTLFKKFESFIVREKPDLMVTERSLYSQNFISSRTITEIIGFCKLICNKHKIPYYLVHVPSWKKYVTGKGNSTKPQIKESILKIYPQLEEATQDECDSVGIGLFYINNKEKVLKSK